MQTIRQTNATPSGLDWGAQISVQLAEGVHLQNVVKNRWELTFGNTKVSFVLPGPYLPGIFTKLTRQGLDMSEVIQFADDDSGELSVIEQLRRLCRAGLLVQYLSERGASLAVMRGTGGSLLESTAVQADECMTLDEGACIHKEKDRMIIDSAACGAQIELADPRLFPIPIMLIGPHSLSDLISDTGLPPQWIETLAAWLTSIGAAHAANEPQQQGFANWSFADRLFHARSRMGRHVGGYGGTFPLRGKIQDPAAVSFGRGGRRVSLAKPDLQLLTEHDLPFTAVFERRQSIRNHSVQPITVEELGHFLYRAARIKNYIHAEPYDFTSRPYPSGGGLYEIEIYVVVNRCEGLQPSLYWYDVLAHSLEHLSVPTPEIQELIRSAGRSAGVDTLPHILLVLSARFNRVFWKYESMGYALILKNVGALYQSFYLVATAMGLAPCALGGGSSEIFCLATGKNFWEESSVGEFILGRPEQKS